MLAAGTSSRMGKTNKMLLPYNGIPMVCHCCLEALRFLQDYAQKSSQSCTLVVVTGYRKASVEKALKPCKEFIENTKAPLTMLIVENKDYRKGQFSSTKVGVANLPKNEDFFICLADMPLVGPQHYEKLVPLLGKHDAVRPFYKAESKNNEDRVPGHPVLHAPSVIESILQKPDDYSVNKVLKAMDTLEVDFPQMEWALDIDSPENYLSLQG